MRPFIGPLKKGSPKVRVNIGGVGQRCSIGARKLTETVEMLSEIQILQATEGPMGSIEGPEGPSWQNSGLCERMDGETERAGRMDRQTDGRMHRQTDRTDGQRVEGRTRGQTDGRRNERTKQQICWPQGRTLFAVRCLGCPGILGLQSSLL